MSVLFNKKQDKMNKIKEILEEKTKEREDFIKNIKTCMDEYTKYFYNMIITIKDDTIIENMNDLHEGSNRVLCFDNIKNIKVMKNDKLKYIEDRIQVYNFYKDGDNIEIVKDEMTILSNVEESGFSLNKYTFLLKEKSYEKTIIGGVIKKESNIFNETEHVHKANINDENSIVKLNNPKNVIWSRFKDSAADEIPIDNNEHK